MRRRLVRALPAALSLLFLATAVAAQVGGGFDQSWSTVDGGGVTFSTGGGYSVGGTSGQVDAGQMTGGGYGLVGGFWGVDQVAQAATATPVGTATATVTGTPPTPTLTITPTVTGTLPTSTPTATATSVPIQVQSGSDDKRSKGVDSDRSRGEKEADGERHQRERTNAGSESDERVEGNIVAVWCDRGPAEIVVANRDGEVTLRLLGEAANLCRYAATGRYLTSDDAAKQTEQLYEVYDFATK